MRRTIEFLIVLAAVAVIVVLMGRNSEEPEAGKSPVSTTTPAPASSLTPIPDSTRPPRPTNSAELSTGLIPLPDKKDIPALTQARTVRVETSDGSFELEIYPEAAPNAVERFLKLVEVGFYNDIPVSRVVPGFVVQFGINSEMAEWKDKSFKDDPSLFQLTPGTIAFAKAGLDTNSTQVFINLRTNNQLADPSMNFTTFGRVTEGWEVVQGFRQVGDASMGLDQATLWADGDAYLERLSEKPSLIARMTVVE